MSAMLDSLCGRERLAECAKHDAASAGKPKKRYPYFSLPEGTPLTQAVVRRVLHYDPQTGVFTRTERTAANMRVGDVAGAAHVDGYLRLRLMGKLWLAHRIAWLYVHGTLPEEFIDHINGERADNRIANLRQASRSINNQNRRRASSNNQLGVLGVRAYAGGRFSARLKVDGRMKHLGVFDTAEEAHAAYVAAKRIHHEGNTL